MIKELLKEKGACPFPFDSHCWLACRLARGHLGHGDDYILRIEVEAIITKLIHKEKACEAN